MRTYMKKFTVYRFEELSDDAKQKAKEWYLNDDDRAYFLHDDILMDAKYYFPESELDCQFSLASCQGDGVNVYGAFYLPEILEKTRDKFTDKEYRRLKFYMESTGATTYKAEPNRRYCYDNSFSIDYTEGIDYYAQDYKNYDAATVEKFNDAIREYIGAFCGTWEKYGYEYLYEISDEEMKDTCDANGWEFFEDGSIA